MTEALTPPLPIPGFLRSHPVRAWRSPAGLWFLRCEALQVGGVLHTGSEACGPIWLLYTPVDADEWDAILQRMADQLQAQHGGEATAH